MRKKLLQVTCILLLTASPYLWAQAASGTLSGKITNPSGVGIPNAAVTVTNVNTNMSQKALTGPEGSFSIAGLPPGTYRIDVETAGYKRTTQQDVVLQTTGPVTINIALEPGNINETVELIGHTPVVQATGGDVSASIVMRTLTDLPVIDRNWQSLVGLLPGVTPPGTALDLVRDPARNRFFSVNGQSPWVNQWKLDGVNNTEPYRNTAVRVIGMPSIQQLDVQTATYPENRGYTAGAISTAMTRPGPNNGWHGDLFEFWSGNVLRARNYFNNGPFNPKPRFVYNQMGAGIGGPIVRDKLFIWGAYEGTFANGQQSSLLTVPTDAMLSGNFSGVPGVTLFQPGTGTAAGANRVPFVNNTIPASMINPTAAALASYFPSPNLDGFSNNYVTNLPFRNHGSKADGRLDYHLNDRANLFLRYGYTNFWSSQESPFGGVIGVNAFSRDVAQNAILGYTQSFGSSLTMDLRMGYNRYRERINSTSDQAALSSAFGSSFAPGNLVGINIAGLPAVGSSYFMPEQPVDNTFDWVGNFGWHSNHHNVRFGFDIRRLRSDGFTETPWNTFGPLGTAYFGAGPTLSATGTTAFGVNGAFPNAFASFLLGAPEQVGSVNYLTTPTIRQSEYAGWLGDVVRFRKLTLDFGVRYEVYSPIEPRNAGGAAFFDPTTNTFNYAGIGNTPMHIGDYDLDNIAPRFGFAYRFTDSTVFRGGYAIQYFQNPYFLRGFMGPITGSVTGVQGTFAAANLNGTFGPTVAATPFTGSLTNGVAAGNLPATVIPTNFDTPYVQSFNAQLQQQMPWGTVLTVGYVGALDRHLPYSQELNQAAPGTGIAGLPFNSPFGRTASTLLYTDGLTSNYNALQAAFQKRFARGLSFNAAYTWSHALGYTNGLGLLAHPNDRSLDYGPLAWDHRQNLVISHVFELPWGRHGNSVVASVIGGWQLNGVFRWVTGAPLAITANTPFCDCPGATIYPNATGASFEGAGGASILNPAAFSAPTNSFGTLGRGAVYAPGYKRYDMSLFKNFHIHDRYNLQIRGEAYNLANTPIYATPATELGSPSFGVASFNSDTDNVYGQVSRQLNLALRIMF